jgi:hypothetical protein
MPSRSNRRMHGFLGSITAWAYVAAGLELRGVQPVDARSVLLESLADHVQVAYLGRTLPESFERRELQLTTNLGQADWQIIGYASQLAAKFVLLHELAHVHLKHFGGARATQAARGDTAEISAFREQELEFAADQFASEHVMDGESTVTAAVVARVAAPIFFYVLAMKEAMLPSSRGPVETMIRVHPASTARAERLSGGSKPPAYLPQWQTLFAVPELLKLVYESAPFQAAARAFASRASSSGSAFR